MRTIGWVAVWLAGEADQTMLVERTGTLTEKVAWP